MAEEKNFSKNTNRPPSERGVMGKHVYSSVVNSSKSSWTRVVVYNIGFEFISEAKSIIIFTESLFSPISIGLSVKVSVLRGIEETNFSTKILDIFRPICCAMSSVHFFAAHAHVYAHVHAHIRMHVNTNYIKS